MSRSLFNLWFLNLSVTFFFNLLILFVFIEVCQCLAKR
ncbi:hypothetical protein P20429_1064 [Pseudoalteromonas sp. BSi20429]|nr:hypothetical protein P20429_1064 [Pseudoalteromonas sp. BSi20429]